jgi:hypothetical protein
VFRKVLTKKRALVLGVVAALAVAGVAIAYWTTTGSGSGTGKVASSNGTISLSGTITEELTPGSTSPVTFTASNTNSSSLLVGTVHAVVSTDKVGCTASDFVINDTEENQAIPAKTEEALTTDGSIKMVDSAGNQDACKGATVTLTLSSN